MPCMEHHQQHQHQQQPAAESTAERWFRATETSAKKWVIRYKAISTLVVFLLLSCASYIADVRKYCVCGKYGFGLFIYRITSNVSSEHVQAEALKHSKRKVLQRSIDCRFYLIFIATNRSEKSPLAFLGNFDFCDKEIEKTHKIVFESFEIPSICTITIFS